MLDGANCLLLDEPTNHLDIAAKEAVEAALESFDGTVLLVTHDRYLVNEVAGRIWAVEDGTLADYAGNYDFYLEERSKRQAAAAGSHAAKPAQAVRKKAAEAAPAGPAGPAGKQPVRTAEKRAAAGRQYTPAEAEKLLPDVELRIREYEALQNCRASEERKILFFRFWTLKESFMKATGLGFRLPLDAFSIIPGPEGVTLRQQVDSRQYYFREYDLQDGYRYALCSAEKPVGAAELTITSFRDLA